MIQRLKELRERRGKIVGDMRALTDKAQTEKRDLTNEEQAQHGKLFEEQDKLRGQIDTLQRQVDLDREMEQRREITPAPATPKTPEEEARRNAQLRMEGFRAYLMGRTASPEAVAEFRVLQQGSDPDGGYLVAPQEFVAELIKFVDNMVFIRQRARKFTVTQAASLGAPSLDTDPDDADWTTELATGNLDAAMKFGKRELQPHPFAKRVKVSKKLLRISTMPAEQIVLQRLGYKFGITEEKAFLTGSGAAQPLGVFTASAFGIPTSRDVSTGNTTTSITFDGLIEAKFSMKTQYWNRADWLFHRDAVKQITKLKDGDGQYIWRQSVRDGEPDMLLGRPLMISEYAPNTFTTGLYVGLFGDFSQYWIVDALDMQVQRLVELYAEANEDGFIGRQETDGMPVLAEAFARVKLA